VLFLKTESLPGLDVICGLFNDAVQPVDIFTKRNDVLTVYCTLLSEGRKRGLARRVMQLRPFMSFCRVPLSDYVIL